MRLTRLSLIAAMLIGSTAFAIENTKVSGDAKLYYGTQDSDNANGIAGNGVINATPKDSSLFSQDSSYTNFAARLDLTTDLTKGVSAGVGMQAVTTLGVEHNLVQTVWSGAHNVDASAGSSLTDAAALQVDSTMWFDELWLAGSAFDTTLKIGRQALDTPLAFSETWGVDKNTFEAVVLINQSLPDTTLVATFIGKSNGSADDRANNLEGGAGAGGLGLGTLRDLGLTAAGYVAQDGEFSTFGEQGTYCFGAVNNSFKPLTAQAWYYDMIDFAEAYWLQADLNIEGVLAGVQFANTDLDLNSATATTLGITNPEDTSAWSAMLGYAMKDVATFKVAYSDVDEDGVLGMANTATGSVATLGGKSKLYTEMWWNYGQVSAVGAESFSITAETTVGPEIALFAGLYNTEIKTATVDEEFTELTLTASKSFGPLDTSVAVIFADSEDTLDSTNDVKTTDIQVYLTYNF